LTDFKIPHEVAKSPKNVLLVKNKKAEDRPVGFLVFSKACLEELDLSDIYFNSIRSIMSMCNKKNQGPSH
jgi:hypothetical protein